jgi:hypothetical protein
LTGGPAATRTPFNLPAAERDEWDRLWADVKAALAEARKPPRDGKPPTPPASTENK